MPPNLKIMRNEQFASKGRSLLAISEIIVPPISVMLCQVFRRSLCQLAHKTIIHQPETTAV